MVRPPTQRQAPTPDWARPRPRMRQRSSHDAPDPLPPPQHTCSHRRRSTTPWPDGHDRRHRAHGVRGQWRGTRTCGRVGGGSGRRRSIKCWPTCAPGWSGILAGLATVFLTLGGIRYVMAGGEPGRDREGQVRVPRRRDRLRPGRPRPAGRVGAAAASSAADPVTTHRSAASAAILPTQLPPLRAALPSLGALEHRPATSQARPPIRRRSRAVSWCVAARAADACGRRGGVIVLKPNECGSRPGADRQRASDRPMRVVGRVLGTADQKRGR